MTEGLDLKISLINGVTGPAKLIKSSMLDIEKTFKQTQKSMVAPAPRRGGMSDWDKMALKAQRSQAADFAREQARAVRLKAAEQVKATKRAAMVEMKEAKRVANFKQGMAQLKLDQQSGMASLAAGGLAAVGTGAAVLALKEAVSAVTNLALAFGRATIAAASFSESSIKSIGMLTGDANTAAAKFNDVRKQAQLLGLDVQGTVGQFQKLLAAQFSVTQSKSLIGLGADLKVAANLTDEAVSRIFLALSQIKSKGKLQAEEMLQLAEAGLSADMVYTELGLRLNKTREEIMDLQKAGKLAPDLAVDAVLAVGRKLTGRDTGMAAQENANSSLRGMWAKMVAGFDNFMIDVGVAVLPKLTRLAKLVTSSLDKLLNDPKVARLGTVLFHELENFVLWTEANWPQIMSMFTTGVSLMTTSIQFIVETFDTGTVKGKIFAGIMGLLALTLGVVALAGFTLMLPLYLLVGAIGMAAYAIYQAVIWIADAVEAVKQKLGSVGAGFATLGTSAVLTAIPGVGAVAPGLLGAGVGESASRGVTTAAESSASARLPAMLAGITHESVTVQGEQQSPSGQTNNINQTFNVTADVNQDTLASKMRNEIKKALEEA